MPVAQPLLEGPKATHDDESLNRENRRLKDKIEQLELDLKREQQKSRIALRAMETLRGPLEPIYRGLRMIFNEFDDAGVTGADSATSAASQTGGTPQSSAKWESWKARMPGKPAEFIELLLIHGEMTGAQLTAASHSSKQTTYQTISRMNKAGILSKNGGRFSLKE
jgi:hypothetical protein